MHGGDRGDGAGEDGSAAYRNVDAFTAAFVPGRRGSVSGVGGGGGGAPQASAVVSADHLDAALATAGVVGRSAGGAMHRRGSGSGAGAGGGGGGGAKATPGGKGSTASQPSSSAGLLSAMTSFAGRARGLGNAFEGSAVWHMRLGMTGFSHALFLVAQVRIGRAVEWGRCCW
jgi:hypothetical protein